MQRIRVYYSGRVQGVGFRMTAQRLARPFGLSGFARNLPDGRVEVQTQGDEDRIGEFLAAVDREMGENISAVEADRLEVDPELVGGFVVRA